LSVEKVRRSVIQQAEAEAEEIIRAAQAESDARLAAAEARLQGEHDTKLARALQEIEEQGSLAVQRAQSEKAKELLSLKNNILAELFERSRDVLVEMPAEECISMLVSWLEKRDTRDNAELLFNRRDRDSIGKKVVLLSNEKLGRDALRLCDETAAISGGFILRAGTYEFDRSYDSLLKALKEECLSELAEKLFSRK